MKFTMILAVVALIAQCGLAQELRNPSFEELEEEQDNPHGDLAAGWGRWGHWINRESAWKPVHDGSCLIGYHHWQIESADDSGLFQDVEGVPAGAQVVFGVHAFVDEDTNAEHVELRLEPLNGGTALASKIYSLSDVKPGTWEKLSVDGSTTEEGVRVLLIVKPAASGTREGCIKLDSASLECGASGESE